MPARQSLRNLVRHSPYSDCVDYTTLRRCNRSAEFAGSGFESSQKTDTALVDCACKSARKFTDCLRGIELILEMVHGRC